jgi:hypothetical protein
MDVVLLEILGAGFNVIVVPAEVAEQPLAVFVTV